MHEASLMADLLRMITTLAAQEEAEKVTRVQVTLGALSHVSPEHFRFHFTQAVLGTIAAGADLDIQVRTDITEPQAQEIRLTGIEVEAD
jgi:hydrogenase nickel incorporation protein HypA/HybF